jgi:DNA-binding LacI/PurR family transcriptional regulator
MSENGKEHITIYRIATEAQVSPATVSRVLNGTQAVSAEKRNRVECIIRKYNYRPSPIARSLSGRGTSVLGFILPDIAHPYYNSLFLAAEQRAKELGYTIFLGNTLNDNVHHVTNLESDYIRLMQENHVDGLLLAGGHIQDVNLDEEYMDDFRNALASTPIITVSCRLPWVECPSVTMDETTGVSLMVDYLVSLRHERIGFLGGDRGIQPTDLRIDTFRSCLRSHGLEFHNEWHFETGSMSVGAGKTAMESLLRLEDRPTAVMCFNDLTAMGAIFAAQQAGLEVPTDISIAGIDNIEFGEYVHPPITTVDLRAPEQGRLAAQALIDLLTGELQTLHTIIEPRLVVRDSCAPPR